MKIILPCPMSSRINPKKLKFLLNQQRSYQQMMIGGEDVVVENLKKLQHNLASLLVVSFSITHTVVRIFWGEIATF